MPPSLSSISSPTHPPTVPSYRTVPTRATVHPSNPALPTCPPNVAYPRAAYVSSYRSVPPRCLRVLTYLANAGAGNRRIGLLGLFAVRPRPWIHCHPTPLHTPRFDQQSLPGAAPRLLAEKQGAGAERQRFVRCTQVSEIRSLAAIANFRRLRAGELLCKQVTAASSPPPPPPPY